MACSCSCFSGGRWGGETEVFVFFKDEDFLSMTSSSVRNGPLRLNIPKQSPLVSCLCGVLALVVSILVGCPPMLLASGYDVTSTTLIPSYGGVFLSSCMPMMLGGFAPLSLGIAKPPQRNRKEHSSLFFLAAEARLLPDISSRQMLLGRNIASRCFEGLNVFVIVNRNKTLTTSLGGASISFQQRS